MEKLPGVISVISEDGSMSTPFDSVLDVLPKTEEIAKVVEQNPVEQSARREEPAAKREPKNEGTGYILANALKDKGIALEDIKEGDDLSVFVDKIASYIDGNTDARAKSLYGEDTIESAKLLNSGMSLEDRSEYARLNLLANHKYDPTEDMSYEEREAMVKDTKAVISEYYSEKLSGKFLDKAIAGLEEIDEYSDELADLDEIAKKHFIEKRDLFKKEGLDRIEATKNAAKSYDDQVMAIIKSGDIGGTKLSKAEIDLALKNINDLTETIEVDGKTEKISKYNKTIREIAKNPVLGAKLMLLVAEGLTLDAAKNMGRDAYATELEQKLRGSRDFPGSANQGVGAGGGRTPLKGIIEVSEQQTY